MSNYNKSFNFRNGVQVDEDDLIVRGSLVGIGTTIPRSELDVRGNIDISGLVTSRSLYVSGIATFTDVRIGTGITIYGNSGIISATYYGDGSNLRGIPTSQWVDINPGTGVTSIYAIGNVGIATTGPTNTLQIGGKVENGDSGVGISSSGNIYASGIVTATTFVGSGSNLTGLNASQITSGTISEDRLPENLNATGIITAATLQAAQINNTGIATISDLKLGQTNISGVATVGFATVSAAYINSLTVGVVTASSLVATSDISVSTLKDVERLSVTGIATVGLVSASDAYVTGVTTTGTISATTGTITNLSATNSASLNNTVVTNLNVTGIATVGMMTSPTIYVGVATIARAEVSAVIAGLTTTTQFVSGAVRIGYGATNEIDTVHTDLVLDSAGGTVVVDDNLNVTGVATVSGALRAATSVLPDQDLGADLGSSSEYFKRAYIGEVNVGAASSNEITTRSNTLILDSNAGLVQVDDNLSVVGYTYLTGVTTASGTFRAATSVLPDQDLGADLGSSSEYFKRAYIGEVNVGAASSNEITTRSNTLILDSNAGLVQVDDNLSVVGYTYLTGITTVQGNLVPDSDQNTALGTASLRFSDAYVDNIRIGVGSDNEISTASGNLKLNAASDLVEISSELSVGGRTTLVGIATIQSGIVPNSDLGSNIGQSSKAFGAAHISGVRIGAGATTLIDTRGGSLVLDSNENKVVVDSDLTVNDSSNLLNEVYIGSSGNSLYVNTTLNRIGIGTSAPSSDVEVVRNGNLNVELVSETGSATLALAQSLGIGNDSGNITYSNGDLSIANKSDTGSINIELAAGTGINTNAFVNIRNKGTSIVSIGDSGVIGINKINPEHPLDVNGNLVVDGSAKITGIVTIGTGINEVTFGASDLVFNANLIGNVYSDSGISTVRNLDVNENVSIGATLSVDAGIGSFGSGVAIGNTNALITDAVGISPLLNVDGSARINGSILFTQNNSTVGIATTGIRADDRPSLTGEDSNFPNVNYGNLQVGGDISVTGYSGGASIFVAGPVGNTTAFLTYLDDRIVYDQNYQYRVGINTHVPRSCLDLGASASPLILPSMDNARKQYNIANPHNSRITVYGASTGDAGISGSLMFNTSTGRAELGIGNTGIMCGIATLTYNGSDHAAFLPPVLTTAEATSLTNSGVPRGSLIYNRTAEELQIKNASAFVGINFVKSFGRVNSGTLQSGSHNATYSNPSGSIARITFDNALPSANYTIVYSHANSNGTWSNVTNTITDQQTTYFEITWGTLSSLDWYFVVLQA